MLARKKETSRRGRLGYGRERRAEHVRDAALRRDRGRSGGCHVLRAPVALPWRSEASKFDSKIWRAKFE